MFIPFEILPPNARIWIYQADRSLTQPEENELISALTGFCKQWSAHGNPLKTSFRIDHHQFIILAVDVNFSDASGCSIDGSVRILKSFELEHTINFFDRAKIAFLVKTEVKTFALAELKDLFIAGKLSPESLTFNNLVATKSDVECNWIVPVEATWLKKYLPKTAGAV